MIESQRLLKEVKKGNEPAFTNLYNQYWRKVYRFSQIYISDPDDISEIVQDVFIRLWESRRQIDEDKSLDGLLFIITRNLIFDHFRKSLNITALKLTALEFVEASATPIEDLEIKDLQEYIQKLISLLPPRQREVFIMSRDQHLTTKEIACQLSISEKAVERNIYLALKFLRSNIATYIILLILYKLPPMKF